MRNFNFAFFLSLFAAINGWVALNPAAGGSSIYISVIVTLPILFLALNSLVRKPEPRAAGGSGAEFDLLAESLPAYLTAMIAAAAFTIFVYKTVSGSGHSAMFFIAPRIAGWTWHAGLVSGMLCLLMGASGLGIWSAANRQRAAQAGGPGNSKAFHIMLMGLTPGVRLAAYYTILFLASIAGGVVVYLVYGATRSNDWAGYMIVAGRSLLPAAAFLPAALLRLPMLPMGILILAGTGVLYGHNTSYPEGAVFAGVQAVIFVVYSLIRISRSKQGRAVVSQMAKEPENPPEQSSAENDKPFDIAD